VGMLSSTSELDELSGRFSPSRGIWGILVCRNFENKDPFWKRCRDTANDERGFIIPLDDGGLENIVEHVKDHQESIQFPVLRDFFDRLIM